MPFDDALADRLRPMLAQAPAVAEVRMMGALVFMVAGHMACGVTGQDLMVRIAPADREDLLARPHVRPFEVGGGRAPRGFLCVGRQALGADADLRAWVGRALAFVSGLPPRKPPAGSRRRRSHPAAT